MCGITGWVSYDRDLNHERETLDAMTQTMACRGPDASGTWVDRHAALGHRRLAIIDLSGGVQPMTVRTPNGDVTLVYSGEAYNYVELRDELIKQGERFTTSSDTEVVLRGYLRWGEAVAERLNGMFAFAIWDARDRKLVMVRDRLGIKPLFYYRTPDGVMFGSEQKAILANRFAKRVVDMDGLRETMAFAMTPGHAVWQDLHQVEPGTVVTVDADGLRVRTYWKLESKPHTDDQETTVAHVRELLDDIVRRQLVADVPRGVLLSGGIDSGTLTAFAAAHLGDEQVRTFAVDFMGQAENFVPDELRDTPDTPYIQDVVKHVGTDHTDIVLNPKELADPEVRKAALTARDAPMSLGDMDFSLYLLFKAIRERTTVALSGESADEVFGGYRHMHDPGIQSARALPWIAVNAGPMATDTSGLNPGLAAELKLDEYRQDAYDRAAAEVDRLDSDNDADHRMRTMLYLHITRFMRFLLDRKDRLSMAVGLEVRVPFTDHRLVDYVYNTPWALKTYDGREKSLLRGAVSHMLPESVAWRPKSPYPSTQDPFYVRELQLQAKELLTHQSHDVFELIDRSWLDGATGQDPTAVDRLTRLSLERTLDLGMWLDVYKPELKLS
ncbi:asparagine synthase (glutamine-hydrolyzing) [Actinosynnema sp. NPDC050801]|uniref:asparagine synthase (glutamine-hydrolyzing) n=1 Tax=unclassified Actinosynnema TaxID=2637065 RepID=UPI0033DEAA97